MSSFKQICLLSAASVAIVTTAAAQSEPNDNNYYSRNKYEAVLERVQPEFDPEPVRLGTFLVRSQLEAGLTATSNARATATDEESDIIARAGVDVAARTDWSVHQIGFDASAYRNQYLDLDDESTTDVILRGLGRVDVTRELSVGGNVFFEDRAEARTDFTNAIGAIRPVEYQRTGVGGNVDYTNDRVRWTNGVEVSNFDFEDSEIGAAALPFDQDFRDNDRMDARTRLSYALSPNVAVFGQATYSDTSFDSTEIVGGAPRKRDSKGYTVAAGVDFELTTLVRGDIAVGFLNDDKEDDFFTDVDGLSVDGRVQWFPTQLSTVTFNAGRRVVDSGLLEAPTAVGTLVGARIDHELRRNIVLSAYASRDAFEYEEIDRDDDITNLGVSATYKLNKRAHVEGFARRVDRDVSSIVGFDPSYGVNLVGVAIKLFP